MQVVAAVTIGTETFFVEVDAGFGFILEGNMHFLSDFQFGMSEGALGRLMVTCYRKGQYPFSTQ